MTSDETGVMDLYQQYVDEFDASNAKGTGRSWTPYRFCSEDWLLAVAVVRASRHRYEIALLGCEDHRDFEPDAGLKAALSFMLADSFHRTGKMELRFCGPRHGEASNPELGYCRCIPVSIIALARTLEAPLSKGRKISHEEGQVLYQKMVGLGIDLAVRLQNIGVDPTRSAFLLHRGAIGIESLSLIAGYSASPRALLEGRLVPDRWLPYKRELLLLRRGLLAERARTALEQGAQNKREIPSVTWLNSSVMQVRLGCPIVLRDADDKEIRVRDGANVEVILAPLDQVELRKLRLSELGSGDPNSTRLLAVPRDYSWLTHQEMKLLWLQAFGLSVRVFRIHESLDELDSEALVRLERFATTRTMIEEQRE